MRKVYKGLFVFLLAAVFIIQGYVNDRGKDDALQMPAMPKIKGGLYEYFPWWPQTDFGIRFFRETAKANPDKNMLVSPYSIFSLLGILYNGAGGTTKDGMAAVMGLVSKTTGTVDTANLNKENVNVSDAIQNTGTAAGTSVYIANSLWINKDFNIKSGFLDANKKYYKAEINNMDFSDAGAQGKINQWVSQKTQGKISDIIGPLTQDTKLVAVDAIYFKGKWQNEFDKKFTKAKLFYPEGKLPGLKKMMNDERDTNYLETDSFQAVELDYKNSNLCMIVFLPAKKVKMADFCASMSAQDWCDWMKWFDERDVDLTLPKFKIEFETPVIDSLTNMGMGAAFDKQADFSGISSGNLFISRAVQKTYMVVDEEGTEAAAASEAEMMVGAEYKVPPPHVKMTVNRPFFIAIVDNNTKAILFAGVVMDPQQ